MLEPLGFGEPLFGLAHGLLEGGQAGEAARDGLTLANESLNLGKWQPRFGRKARLRLFFPGVDLEKQNT